jgi:hypothetical protein
MHNSESERFISAYLGVGVRVPYNSRADSPEAGRGFCRLSKRPKADERCCGLGGNLSGTAIFAGSNLIRSAVFPTRRAFLTHAGLGLPRWSHQMPAQFLIGIVLQSFSISCSRTASRSVRFPSFPVADRLRWLLLEHCAVVLCKMSQVRKSTSISHPSHSRPRMGNLQQFVCVF